MQEFCIKLRIKTESKISHMLPLGLIKCYFSSVKIVLTFPKVILVFSPKNPTIYSLCFSSFSRESFRLQGHTDLRAAFPNQISTSFQQQPSEFKARCSSSIITNNNGLSRSSWKIANPLFLKRLRWNINVLTLLLFKW